MGARYIALPYAILIYEPNSQGAKAILWRKQFTINMNRPSTIYYIKQADNEWLQREDNSLSDSVSLFTLPVSFTLAEVYGFIAVEVAGSTLKLAEPYQP